MDGRTAPGIDFSVSSSPPFTEIVPCAAGWVWDTGREDGIGEYITVTHGASYYTLYAHLTERFVTEGAPVNRSTVMALGGNTGENARGVWHLHLGLLVPEHAWHDDFMAPGDSLRWADPDAFSESGKRLEYWSGNDLDTPFQQEVKSATASVDTLWNYLLERGSPIARMAQTRSGQLRFSRALRLLELGHKSCGRCANPDEAEFLGRVRQLKRIRPVLTSPFPNPALKQQYVRLRRLSRAPTPGGYPERSLRKAFAADGRFSTAC